MILLLSLLLASPSALAQSTADEAEVNFQLGTRAYKARDFEAALAWFMASNRLAPNKNVSFNIARSYARLGRYAEAWRWYADALDGITDPGARATILAEQQALLPEVAIFEIQSNPPGAKVFVNRKNLGSVGVTPLVLALPPGEATFILESENHQEATSARYVAQQGTRNPVQLDLRAIVGRVVFEGVAGATVHLGNPDNPALCTLPCEAELLPGSQVVWARLDGYDDSVRQIDVVDGSTTRLSMPMVAKTGSMLVDIPEQGALIEVDGVAMGFTPAVVSAIPVGEHAVRISRRGYRPAEARVLIRQNELTTLSGLELTPVEEVAAVSKLSEDARTAPSSVTILSGAELRAFGYPTIYEALRGVRGMALTMDSAYSGVAVRGLGQPNDFGNRMLILSDGATLNDDILFQSFIGYDGRVDLGDVERIEVVRGPGSVLYGTGAVLGVVNLVPLAAETPAGQELSLGVAPQDVGRVRLQTRHGGPAAGVHLSASGALSQGRTEALGDTVVEDFDRFQAGSASVRAWGKDLVAQGFTAWRHQIIPTGAYGTRLGDDRTVWDDLRVLGELRYEPRLSSTWSLSARAHGNLYDFAGDYAYDDGEGGSYVSTEDYQGIWGGVELRTLAQVSPAFRLTLGSQLDLHPIIRMTGFDTYEDGSTAPYMDETSSFLVAAGYAMVDGSPAAWLRYSLGARLDYWSTFGASINPRAAVVLTPTELDTAKLMVGRAFRAPSTYERLYNVPGVQVRPDEEGFELKPEEVWSLEAEYTRQLHRFWTATVAGHGSRSSQIIETVSASTADGAVTYQNSDEPLRIVGVDAELRRAFRNGWMATLSYGWLSARYAEDGSPITNAPHHFASGKVIAPLALPQAQLALRTSLEAPRLVTPEGDRTAPALISDLVLSGQSHSGQVGYRVGLYNLLDQDHAVPVTEMFAVPTMPQQGRSLLAELTLRR